MNEIAWVKTQAFLAFLTGNTYNLPFYSGYLFMHIIPMADPVLLAHAAPIDLAQIHTAEVQDKINAMLELYSTLQALGLAAPQVGWSARVFLIGFTAERDRTDKEGMPLAVFVNPEFEVLDSEIVTDFEGCFSVCHEENHPKTYGQVGRVKSIRIKAYNQQGEPIAYDLHDFKARVFQHEYDHLNGIRFLNRMQDDGVLYLQKGEEPLQFYLKDLPLFITGENRIAMQKILHIILNAPVQTISDEVRKKFATSYRRLKFG
jgi:peptide deformylase